MTTYDERLWPPIWLWLVGLVLVMSLAASFYVAAGGLAAGLIASAAGGLMSWGLLASAARVQVCNGELIAGRARIPVSLLDDIEALDAARARAVRGPESDPAGYHLIRGWIAEGVRASVRDPGDVTPYWFIASRHPAALAEAIEQAKGAGPSRPLA